MAAGPGATVGPGQSQWLAADSLFSLPSPPTNDLEEARQVRALSSLRTPQRLQEIQNQAPGPVSDFFEAAGVITTQCPAQAYFATAIVSDTADVVFALKRHFSRLRPHQVLPDVKPAIEVPWHAAYPSGHATQARLLARVFATWYPEKAPAFAALAKRIAQNREVAGVHYPSDSAAGASLGDQLFTGYQKNHQVQDFLSKPCRSDPSLNAATPQDQRTYSALSAQSVVRLQMRLGQWQSAGDGRKTDGH
jgi:hypothetical protein